MTTANQSGRNGGHNRWLRPVKTAFGLGIVTTVFSACRLEAATMTLYPVADNWINSCSSGCGVNNGDQAAVQVRSAALLGDVKNMRALIRFDLSNLPSDGGRITCATLGLYFYDYHWNSPEGRVYTVHRVTNSWEELASTWQARDDYSTGSPLYWESYLDGIPVYQPGGGDFAPNEYASATVPLLGNWMTWDVAALVREWVDGSHPNEGLLIKDADEFEEYPGYDEAWGPAQFHSVDYWDETLWPFLEVTFFPPGDFEPDGDVDFDDLVVFIDVLLGVDTNPDHVETADMNGDAAPDGEDIQPFLRAMFIWPPS